MPDASGLLICRHCGGELKVRSRSVEAPIAFKDITGRCVVRLREMMQLDAAMLVECPWREFGQCDIACRCLGARKMTIAALREHYTNLAREFDTHVTALDEAILTSIGSKLPKRFKDVFEDVENTYGSISPTPEASRRKLHHKLRSLVARGRALRSEIDKCLYAYLHPEARIQHDHEALSDFIETSFA